MNDISREGTQCRRKMARVFRHAFGGTFRAGCMRRQTIYDTIIVGARCAGAPLAMLLNRRGAKVLLVDRATFPRDISHGHFVHRHRPHRLRDWQNR